MTDPYCEECGVLRDQHVDMYCRMIQQQKNALRERSHVLERYRDALQRIAGLDFVITLPDRMDAVRAIAREALE